MNNSVVHRDGSKFMLGSLNMNGQKIVAPNLNDLIVSKAPYSSTALTSGAGVLQDMHADSELTIAETGTHLLIATGHIEASLSAAVLYRIVLNSFGPSVVGLLAETYMRLPGTLGTSWNQGWAVMDGAQYLEAGDVINLKVSRDVTSGTSLFRRYAIAAIRIGA